MFWYQLGDGAEHSHVRDVLGFRPDVLGFRLDMPGFRRDVLGFRLDEIDLRPDVIGAFASGARHFWRAPRSDVTLGKIPRNG